MAQRGPHPPASLTSALLPHGARLMHKAETKPCIGESSAESGLSRRILPHSFSLTRPASFVLCSALKLYKLGFAYPRLCSFHCPITHPASAFWRQDKDPRPLAWASVSCLNHSPLRRVKRPRLVPPPSKRSTTKTSKKSKTLRNSTLICRPQQLETHLALINIYEPLRLSDTKPAISRRGPLPSRDPANS
jgi:hypothetical protein